MGFRRASAARVRRLEQLAWEDVCPGDVLDVFTDLPGGALQMLRRYGFEVVRTGTPPRQAAPKPGDDVTRVRAGGGT